MIEFKNAAIRRGADILFANVNLQLHPRQKIGLTGNNGSGKSSFLATISGQLALDSGTMSIPTHWQQSYMAQEITEINVSAIDYVLAGDGEWFAINEKLNATTQLNAAEIASLYQRFEEIDGYRTPSRAAEILAGLGITPSQHSLKVSEFSGGWQMRLNLARTLMCRADAMLLDEPTNHLDLEAILWLEEWLGNYDGMAILISHDQRFLDACVDHILHIENQSLTLYSGNYSQFVRTRSERLAQQQQNYDKQQATRAHLQDYIRRFRAKASKAKQAQSRIKQLERMPQLAAVLAENPFSFSFYTPQKTPQQLISLEKADIGYCNKALLTNVCMRIMNTTRLGLLGLNGAGKSTLIKALLAKLPLLAGEHHYANDLQLGYFNQHQIDNLDGDASPLAMLQALANDENETQLRTFLGSFNFCGDRVNTPSKFFSGGERARLTLALIVWQRPNLLVLDEPTNHLDLQMRQALTLALQGFSGAVVLVSHDRELMANICDELYLVDAGKVVQFAGDLLDYIAYLSDCRKKIKQIENTASTVKISKEQQRQRKAKQRELTAPIQKRIDRDEKQLQNITVKLQQLNITLGDNELYSDDRKTDLLAILAQQSAWQRQCAVLEEKIINAMFELEEAQQLFEIDNEI